MYSSNSLSHTERAREYHHYRQGHDFRRRIKVALFLSRVVTWFAVAWMILAMIFNMPVLIALAAGVGLFFFLSTVLLTRQYYTLGRAVLMGFEVLAITVAIHDIGPEGRLDLALLISFATPFMVYSWKYERGYILFFATISIASWIVAWYTQGNLFGYHEVNPTIARIYFSAATSITLFGVITTMILYFTRVTLTIEAELEQAQRKADQASHTKSQFLARMSHELRTPMHAIMGMSELALKYAEQPKQIDYLHKVTQASNQLMGVISTLLDFSNIENQQLGLEHLPFQLDELLQEFAVSLQQKATGKGIDLVCEFHTDLCTEVSGDPRRINQILSQLADNAVKFTPQGGNIALRVASEHQPPFHVTLNVTIEDNGIGIEAQHRERLFEAFSQQDESSTRQFGGTGLGLSLTKKLVEMMGGEIRVESEAGRGSTFHVRIVLKKTPEHLSAQGAHAGVI